MRHERPIVCLCSGRSVHASRHVQAAPLETLFVSVCPQGNDEETFKQLQTWRSEERGVKLPFWGLSF